MGKVVITGAGGFVGGHLARLLVDEGQQVLGLGLHQAAVVSGSDYCVCDLKETGVARILADFEPDYIFHLAAKSSVADSWRDPVATYEANVLGQLRLLEAAAAARRPPRVIIACSSDEYGIVTPDELPITEDRPLRPNSPYAVSKVCQDYLGYQYFTGYGLPVIRTRGFNHTGPGQGAGFVCSDFAAQIARIEKGLAPAVLRVGNLEARRDFTDVRDVVRAYLQLALAGQPGEVYNVCSGSAYSIQEIVDLLLGFSQVRVSVEKDPAKGRPSDIPVLLGDNGKLARSTGWKPEIPFEQTLEDLLDWWRERVAREMSVE